MSSFPILDLVVGVIFVFFLLSIVCSSIVEMTLTVRKVRADVLGTWITTIFDTEIKNAKNETVKLGKEIIDHCALTGLTPKGESPSYIDPTNFVSALLDKVTTASEEANPTTITAMITSLATTTAVSDELKRSFLIFANEARDTYDSLSVKTMGAVEIFRNKMEDWYNSNMQRLAGVLKTKYTRRFTIYAAIVVCVLINADIIAISKYLYSNPDARAALAAQAYNTADDDAMKQEMLRLKQNIDTTNDDTAKYTLNQLDSSVKANIKTINKAKAALDGTVPIGWSKAEFKANNKWYDWIGFGLSKIIGIALTVIAIMMGAPFWFDVLNKVSNLRGTGNKPSTDTKTS